MTVATSGGNVTSDGGASVTARGVCWSTSSNPTIANSHTTDGGGTGSFISNITGLAGNTFYYLRAYATNSIGTTYGDQASFNTASTWACGDGIIINHVAGNLAPVSKTVTYGTVTNIPGETLRCWITSNLGADHQATAKNDITEASVGWYWQFSRKQGYKHDGTTRTPNTTWITSIDETSDWQPVNDPCTIELGSSWRIPTSSEWTNVDVIGSWNDWNGPWNSALKMHAAGFLSENGALYYTGSYGSYWSNNQGSYSYAGISLNLSESYGCYINYSGSKAYGHSLRCLRY